MKAGAIFLDRDGTLIEDRGDLASPEDMRWLPGAIEALRLLCRDFSLFLVTNQSGIGRGVITSEDVEQIHKVLCGDLIRAGVSFHDIYVCPHRKEDHCLCRKPRPYFLHLAADKYGINLTESFVIGDHPHDVELARNAGAIGIYVLTGHGDRHRHELSPSSIAVSDVMEAARWILSTCRKAGA